MRQCKIYLPNGWDCAKIDEIGTIYSGSTPATNNSSFWGGNILWITPNDLSKLKSRNLLSSERRITKLGLKKSSTNLLPAKSLVMSSRAPIGYIAIPSEDFCTNQGCKTIVFNSGHDVEFHYYNFLFNIKTIKEKGEGTTFAEISKKALGDIQFLFPEYEIEQSKIAEILSTVDSAIEKTDHLIEKYKCIKQGLMQDLFRYGIDENGQIRSEKTHKFKDSLLGRIPAEWDYTVLGNMELYELKTGGTPSTENNLFWQNGHIPWFSSGEIHKKTVHYTDNFITDAGYRNSNACIIPKKSTLIALAGQGKTRGSAAITEIELTTNQSVAAIIPKKRIDPYFLYYYMDSKYENLRAISAGAGRAGLSLKILSQYMVINPIKNEQEKISKLLLNIDELIQKEGKEINKLISLKFGLMNDLLSGNVRVTHLLKENG